MVFRSSGDRFEFLDRRLRDKNANSTRKHTWFLDQYKNPHESKHTFGEVQRWFEMSGIEFMNSIPKSTVGPIATDEQLFKPHPRGSRSITSWFNAVTCSPAAAMADFSS